MHGKIRIRHAQDDQVKVRGVRIELGEIIATLSQHPAVQANTVIANKDAQGQNYLVAYVVPMTGMKMEISALRTYLSQTLIPAMVPTAFVTLEHLPLLPTGKVDRRQLPEPELISARPENSFVAPDGAVEERLAEVWQEILKIERVGARDNFFELGGNSLLAYQVINRIRSRMGVEIPVHGELLIWPILGGCTRIFPS